jgi:ribosomal protein S17E
MSAGIYQNNGVYAYSMNLEKKLKRRPNAEIIEEYTGNLTGSELETELQKMLDKYNINKPVVEEPTDNILKYHWRNKVNGYTLHSIYPTLGHVSDPQNWEPYNE